MTTSSWLVVCLAGLTACTTEPAWNGTYKISTSGDTCHPSDASSIDFKDNIVGVGYPAKAPLPTTYSVTNVVFDHLQVTFDSAWSYRNTDSFDFSSDQEHYALTVSPTTMTGTVDGTYNGEYYSNMWSCTATLTVTGTRI
ncbi:MAG TPA: hypothetical protein VFQ65_13825 [Kofleriaceae bacterium]|nr:hypothetical protein [Kofleriaceae bacterium]